MLVDLKFLTLRVISGCNSVILNMKENLMGWGVIFWVGVGGQCHTWRACGLLSTPTVAQGSFWDQLSDPGLPGVRHVLVPCLLSGPRGSYLFGFRREK